MKRLALHLAIPALVAVWAFASALRFEGFSFGAFGGYFLLGFLYYASPHLLWAFVAAFGNASAIVCNAGFIGAHVALIAVVSVSFTGQHDPSGLPLQWLGYWPLALVLVALFAAVTAALRYGISRVGA